MRDVFYRIALPTFAIFHAVLSGAASGAPIFEEASLSRDAISPNGDGVQDEAIVTYDVAVDSAEVRILVRSASSGAIVDTLQSFTRQGEGLYALPFPKRMIPDDEYEIRLFGVGLRGEGTEEIVLPILVDTQAPAFIGFVTPSPPVTIVQNGDVLGIRACLDEPGLLLSADFSAFDSEFNPDLVTQETETELCTIFRYTISETNTRSDAQNVRVVISAMDPAGNERSVNSSPLCLSNHPPSVREAEILNPTASFQNGDRIDLRYRYNTVPNTLTIDADFGALDSEFNRSGVVVTPLGSQTFLISYEINLVNDRPDGTYAVTVTARDQGCGVVTDESLFITLDNSFQIPVLLDDVRLSSPVITPNGDGVNDEVSILFTTLEPMVNVSVFTEVEVEGAGLVNQVILSPTDLPEGDHEVVWDGTVSGLDIEDVLDQDLVVSVRARSQTEDRQRQVNLDLRYDRHPPRLLSVVALPDAPLKNGDLAEFELVYDEPLLPANIRPDFTNLDSAFVPGSSTVLIDDLGDNRYRITYAISLGNTREDGSDILVPVEASDVAGNVSSAPDVVRLCLSNLPPVLLEGLLTGDPGPYRNGDTIVLETRWTGGFTPYRMSADFSAVDTGFLETEPFITLLSTDAGVSTYRIQYEISPDNEAEVLSDQPVWVTARDDSLQGCGTSREIAVLVSLDNERPPQPDLDPIPDDVLREPRVQISGIAPQAVRVEVQVNNEVVDTFLVALPDSAFSGEAPLVPGENSIRVLGIDSAGNLSIASAPRTAYYVEGTDFAVPERFRPNDAFVLILAEPASGVLLRIFDLEGLEIRRLEEGSGDFFEIPWDGLDYLGELTSSGPFVAVIDISRSGGSETRKSPFVFTRR